MRGLILWCALAIFAAALPVTASASQTGFYNIAHMANTPTAVSYAVYAGANGLEIDLTFKDDGSPDKFYHGTVCDCSCASPEICGYLYTKDNGNPPKAFLACEAATKAADLLEHIASRPGVALVIIDSKLNDEAKLAEQGKKVIPFLDTHLFDNGYKGAVVVGTAKLKSMDYIRAAATAAKDSSNKTAYTFSVDQEGDDVTDVLAGLAAMPNMSKARAVGTGTTACAPGNYEEAITLAYANERAGSSGLTYIWTIDKTSSMKTYIQAGARGIITNRPKALAKVVKAQGLSLAKPQDRIPRARYLPMAEIGGCDCDYSPGGCKISDSAPAGFACKCKYKGAWTCGGDTVACSNKTARQCLRPDKSKAACKLGGGDCDGY